MRELKREGKPPGSGYVPKPYDPAAYLDNGDRPGWTDYHPTYHRKSRDIMHERFPINLVQPLPLDERGEMPPTVPDMDIIDLHDTGFEHLLTCDLCMQPWVVDVKRAWRRRRLRRGAG